MHWQFYFAVELNPAAKTAYVTILPSDDAFGIISFAPDSLSRIVRESSGSTVYLTVRRTRGLLGPSNVYWQVSGPGAPDVENTNGFVLLSEFSNETQIAIRIRQDAVCCFIYYLLSLSPQSVCLSVCPSVRLFIGLPICHVCLVCPSVCRTVSRSFGLSVCPSVSLSICLFICLSVSPLLSPSIHLSVCIFVCQLVDCSVCLSVRLSVCWSLLLLSVPLSICPSIRLSLLPPLLYSIY